MSPVQLVLWSALLWEESEINWGALSISLFELQYQVIGSLVLNAPYF